jgi:hypothetical protein
MAIACGGLFTALHSQAQVQAVVDSSPVVRYLDQAFVDWMSGQAVVSWDSSVRHSISSVFIQLGIAYVDSQVAQSEFSRGRFQFPEIEYTISPDTLDYGLIRHNITFYQQKYRTKGGLTIYELDGILLSVYMRLLATPSEHIDTVTLTRKGIGHVWPDLVLSRLISYDKQGWNLYAARRPEELGLLPETFIEGNLKLRWAYLALLGLTPDRYEYGWICEYSTMGMAPDQRDAILELVNAGRVDLISKVLRGMNTEGQVYAAEALLYLEMKGGELSDEDEDIIDFLFDSNPVVRTCGNGGSFKIYPEHFNEVLSDENLANLESQYDEALSERFGKQGE